MTRFPLILAHRGGRNRTGTPENSLRAFQASLRENADGFELDIFALPNGKEYVLPVCHGELDLLTDGKGHILDHDWSYIKTLRLRDAKGHTTLDSIPLLDQVLDIIKPLRRDFLLNIEIKSPRRPKPAYLHAVVETLAATLEKRIQMGWLPQHFLIASFNLAILQKVQRRLPDFPIGVLLDGGKAPGAIAQAQLLAKIRTIKRLKLKPYSINLTLPSLGVKAIQAINGSYQKEGLKVAPIAWTFKEKHPSDLSEPQRRKLVKQLTTSGITALITDYPKEMRELLISA